MPSYRIREAVALSGRIADTFRHWFHGGKPHAERDEPVSGSNRAGTPLFERELRRTERTNNGRSARNCSDFVTGLNFGGVTAQSEIAPDVPGSAHSRPGTGRGLRPEPGVPVVAMIKSTDAVVERSQRSTRTSL
ncbi:MerR family transcriptional regulator [Streptomyces sp. NBC_00344]|uniref:MerR family transcriptional regulator n=1 Tax=Streptomyces sp. NBC_00344 TaxID=2975720 RepID=UPI002E22F5BD